MYRLAIGFCSGTLASMANIPFDVAKSRIQGPQPQPGVIKYRSTFASVAMVYREEGCVKFLWHLLTVQEYRNYSAHLSYCMHGWAE